MSNPTRDRTISRESIITFINATGALSSKGKWSQREAHKKGKDQRES